MNRTIKYFKDIISKLFSVCKDSVDFNRITQSELDQMFVLKPCPYCGGGTRIIISICTDLSCCGIPHSVECNSDQCNRKRNDDLDESFDLKKLVYKWKKSKRGNK